MYLNHQLKTCLFDFLSNTTFSGYEFKDLRQIFIHAYPEFNSKKYYAKIYQTIRELVSDNLILIDCKTCTYKYSSNYSKNDLMNLIPLDTTEQIRYSLLIEHTRVIENIDLLNNELAIYQSYINRFPILKDSIFKLINIKKKELNFLKSESSALKNILEVN